MATAQTTITVSTTIQGPVSGACSLHDAILIANGVTLTDGSTCATGTAPYTIVLAASTTYQLSATDSSSSHNAGTPDISSSNLTIVGQGAGSTIIQDTNTSAMAIFSLTGGNLTLYGLTVTGGVPGVEVPCCYTTDSLNVNNSTFSNNTNPGGYGGAIYVYNYYYTVNISITNSLFSGNSAYYQGGAIYFGAATGTLSFSNSSFVNNSTTYSNYGGGAIWINSGTSASFQYTSFSGNSGPGGGAMLAYIPLSISNSAFTNNTASSVGGALYLGYGATNSTITASTFSGNTAGNQGGAIYRFYGTTGQVTKLSNVTISGNTATNAGGGIYLYGIGLNSSYGSGLDLNNVTISGNTASTTSSNSYGNGGGIAFYDLNPDDFFTFENTIIAGNTDNSNVAPDCSTVQIGSGAGFLSQGYNLVGNNKNCAFIPTTGDQVGTSSVPINPLLGPLQNNGAFLLESDSVPYLVTVTTFVCGPGGLTCPEPSTQALLLGSPAIDKGNPATPGSTPTACETTDELGQTRPQHIACDIGAFETDITASPLSLSFPPESTGSSSPAQTVTFTNLGNPSLTMISIGTSNPDFIESDSCMDWSAAVGTSCTINVVFAPTTTATGLDTATLTIQSSDGSNPVTVNLTGQENVTGVPFAQLTPPVTVPFGSQTIGTTSSPQTVTLANTGTTGSTLTVTGITTTGDFAVSSTTCGTLPATLTGPTGSCTISVTFTPTIFGAEVGSLIVTDNSNNVTGSQQSLILTGTGIGVGLSATTLTFPDTGVGNTSAPQTLTFTNTTANYYSLTAALSGPNSGDFAVSASTCSTLIPSGTCTMSVTFKPSATGPRTATLTITGGPSTQTVTVALIGGGIATNFIAVNTTEQFATSSLDCTLGDAITAANNGTTVNGCVGVSGPNTITVPAGTYDLTHVNNLNRDAAFPDMNTNITIQGAGAGATIIQRDPSPDTPSFAIFSLTGSTMTLNGVTVTGGQPGLEVPCCYVSATLNVNNSTFSNNSYPSSSGGAIYVYNYYYTVNLSITNSLFSGNSATYSGGAIYFGPASGTLSISNSSFTNNSSINNYSGGAIYINSGTSASLQYTSFSGNSGYNGGAVADYIPLTVANSTFTNNTASYTGGGLYLQGSGVNSSITASTFSGNTAQYGGAIYRDYGTAGQVTKLSNVTLSGNTATYYGGGIAVYNTGGLDLNNVTISGNTAQASPGGGGIAFYYLNPDDSYTFENTIIAGNTDTSNTAPDCSTVDIGSGAGFLSQGYNLVGNNKNCAFIPTSGDQVGTNSVPISPQLGPLQNNGAMFDGSLVTTFVCGPTGQPQCPEPSTQAPLLGSPAIDKGNPATPGSGPAACATADERGVPRPLGLACDIGAYEVDINVSPLALSFPPTNIGSSSAPQTITFTNYSIPGLTITSVSSSSPDFTPTNGCPVSPSSVGVGMPCTISVVFAPTTTTTGTETATLTIQSSDGSSPVTVSLTGQENVTGVPFAQLTPPVSLPFSSQTVGTTSAPQTVTLANTGTTGSTLTITSIATTGTFAVSSTTCGTLPATLVAPGSCTINVTFTPTIVGGEVGSLTVTDNANNVTGSQQSLILTGTGIGVGLSATTLTFPDTPYTTPTPTPSAPQTLTLTNTTGSTVSLSLAFSGANPGDFAERDNCSSVAASGTCTVSVTFAPLGTGPRTATLTISGAGVPTETVALIGGGVATGVIAVNTTEQTATSSLDCTLGDAITAANTQTAVNGCAAGSATGNTITVPAGTYDLTHVNNVNRNAATPDINTNLTIQGAGAGATIIQRDPSPDTPSFANFSLTGATLTLNGLTVTGGQPGLEVPCCYVSATLNVNNSTFSNNIYPSGSGGAIYVYNYYYTVNLNITNSLFSGNSATYYGGAIYFEPASGTLSVSNSSFVNNSTSYSNWGGGAIYIGSGTSNSIRSCNFSGNSGNYGGAVYDYNTPLTVSGSAFTNNTASNAGGGLYLWYGATNSTITASTFSGNTAQYGGAIYRDYGTAGQVTSLTNDTISGNTATGWGGGIGVYSYGGLNLNNVTISGNTAQASPGGGGIAFYYLNPNDFYTFENTIIAGNTDTSSTAPDCSTVDIGSGPGFTSRGYNLVGNNMGCTFTPETGDQVGTSSVPINPLLGPLQNNNAGATFVCGPAGQTCPANSTEALLLGSPAIDAGNPATPGSSAEACATTDERGVTRPQGTACDIGAFEADINISPSSLSFPPESMGSASAAQTVTFTNYSNPSLTITSVTSSSPDFTTPTNTCAGTLAVSSSCTISVVFSPTTATAGVDTGALTISTSDPSASPGTVNLTGQANVTLPFAQLTPPVSLSFGSQGVGTASSAQSVTLANTGNAALTITSIATTGDFAQTNNCPSSLAAGSSCTISVTFTPTIVGAEVGSLVVTDNSSNVAGSRQSLVLTGTGIGVGLSATALTFPDTGVGSTSAAQTLTLTNTTTSTETLTFAFSGADPTDFLETDNCSSVAASATCTVSVTFTPAASGTRTATLTITGGPSPETVALIGGGVATGVIAVNTTAQFASSAADCALGDAITAANTQTPVNGCAAGAATGNTITLPAGTYHLDHVNNSSRSAGTPDVSTNITIQGAGAATTIIQRDAGAPVFEIFSLTGGPLTLNNLTVSGGEPAVGVIYSGLTLNINGSTFNSNPAAAVGGGCPGCSFNLSSLTINNSTFSNNTNPSYYGGAIYGYASTATITNSLFSGNTATYGGGAIWIQGGTISVANSSFQNNSSTYYYYYYGGAIVIYSATSASLQSCNFSGNSGYSGAAVYDYNTPLTVSGSAFTNNSAGYEGGALYLYYATNSTITGSTFSGNTAEYGGAIYRDYGTPGEVTSLTNDTISGNTATYYGGGMAVYDSGGLNLNNVTISGNTAQNSNNYAAGGGIAFVSLNASDTYEFENSIIAGNHDPTGVAPDCSTVQISPGSLTSQGYNLIGNNTGCTFTAATGDQVGTASSPIDPVLGVLAANSPGAPYVCGPNSLMCPANQTLALLVGSTAIDGGNPATPGSGPPACAATDENGVTRPIGTACDIGAFEGSVTGSANLVLSMYATPSPVAANSALTYTLTITNNGPNAAAGTILSDTLPAAVTFVSSTPSRGTCTGTTTVSCILGTLSVGASANITIVVTSPAAGTILTNTATISSDATNPIPADNTATVNTPVGPSGAVTLSPSSLSFGSVNVGASSAAQTVTLTNSATSPLAIAGIVAVGDYAQTNNCGSIVAASASCTISVVFTPTAGGVRNGALIFNDTASNSPQSVALSGTGVVLGSLAAFSSTSLTFPDQAVGVTSDVQVVTLTNNGVAAMSITSIVASGDFAQTNTCGTSLAVLASCTIDVTFTPTELGARTGAVTITDNAPSSPQVIVLAGNGILQAPVVTVNTTSQFFVNPGDCALGDAITAVNTGTVVNGCDGTTGAHIIVVPAGTYDLTTTSPLNSSSGTPSITSNITIQGAGAGSTIIQRDPAAPVMEIFYVNTSGRFTLNDATITGGEPGVYVSSGSLSVERCTFDANPAGAIQSYGTTTVDSSTFTNNSNPSSYGGAIYSWYSTSLTITNSSFSGNSAYYGGAIYTSSGTVTITNSSFTNNSTTYYGGAAYFSSSFTNIQSSNFAGNTTAYSGGAIYGYGTLKISNSTLANNSVSSPGYYGGAVWCDGSLTITGSTLSGNSSAGSGGAVYLAYSSTGQLFSVGNTTITGNSAGSDGGGITVYDASGSLAMNNVTLTNNTAGDNDSTGFVGGGGLSLEYLSSSGTYTIQNSIIALNTDATNVAPDCSTLSIGSGTLTSQGYNLIGNNTGCTFTAATGDQVGTATTPINPVLGALANNGGASYVCGPGGLLCAANQTEALLVGSTAIDAGNPGSPGTGGTTCLATDERGVIRPVGSACSIGAFEGAIPGTASLVLGMTGSASSVNAGSNLTYSLTIANNGPDTATAVTLTDPLPAGVTFVSVTPSQGSCTGTTTIVCNLGNMPNAATANVSLVVTTITGGTLTNTATLTGTSTNPNPSSASATVTTTVVPTVAANLSTTSLSFGNQLVGVTSSPQGVVLTNSGSGPLLISSIVTSGDFAQTNSCASSVAGGASCTISVTYTPTIVGAEVGTLTLTDTASNSPQTVSLSGTGVAGVPIVSPSAASLTFGSQVVGTTSAAQIVTVTNTGTAALSFTGFATSAEFALDASTTTCSTSSSVALGLTCTVGVTFTPAATGTRAGTLTISDNASSGTVITLSGTGVEPGVSLAPSSLTFGSTVVGTTSVAQSVTLTNSGTSNLDFTAITPSGDFALDPSTTCSASTPVAPSGTCAIAVNFTPTATGTLTGTITISDDADGGTQTIALSGTGTAPGVSLTPSSLTFASQMVGTTSAVQSVTLTNTGTSNLTITALSISGDYALDPSTTCSTSAPVAPSGTCTIAVTFTPTATGTRAGAVTITDNASSSPQTVVLTGTGTAPAVSVSLTLVFPEQAVGTTSAVETVALANSGTAPLTVSSVTISGDFQETDTCAGTTVAVGGNCTISVTFTPSTTGLRTGTLTITDNAPGSPHTVALSGTGVTLVVSATPASLSFNNPLNLVCPVKTVTLANTGTGKLNISSITISSSNPALGTFAVDLTTSTCTSPSTLLPSTACVINVSFTPVTTGTVPGTLSIASNAPTSPTVVALTGTGSPACTLSTSAAEQTVLRGTDSVDFTISDQKPSCTPDPIQLTCTVDSPATCALAQTTIPPEGSTTLTVGNLTAVGSAPVHVQVVKTSGFRTAAVDMSVYVSDFAINEYPGAATVSAGQTASYAMTLTPVNGLTGSIQFSCQGAPTGANCSVSPPTVALNGTSPVQASITVTTTARSLGGPRVPPIPPLGGMPRWVWLLGVAALLLVTSKVKSFSTFPPQAGRLSTVSNRGGWRLAPAFILAGMLVLTLLWAACGGGGMTSNSNPGTPAGTYELRVKSTYVTPTGQISTLSHTTTVTLNVN